MFHVPEFYPDISVKVARVLEEIGVNEMMILKRRRTMLLIDTLVTITDRLRDNNTSIYTFGSQSEGTTTRGLLSDTDTVICNHNCNVIQDRAEWEQGLSNLLMIQEESTPPGYCMLQRLNDNVPTAVTEIPNTDYVRYRGDKVLMKNTFMDKVHTQFGSVKNGPAGTHSSEGFCDQDYVFALPFKTLPEFLRTWIQQQAQEGKLSQDMKRYIEANPCYVVPVGRKDSSFQETEWRISTSHAERCHMFNLNITQLHCYIMLKLLLKTHLKHPQEKALSSFMCKNILLLCIGKTRPSKWVPQNLLSVFTFVLLQLKQSILQKHCPHFILHENNLMARTFSSEVKRWLLERLQFIYETHGRAFLDIEIDDIGNRLRIQLNSPSHCILVRDIAHDQSRDISGSLFYNLALGVSSRHRALLMSIISGKNSFNGILTTLVQLNHHGNYLDLAASRLLTPLICTSLGSVIASRYIYNNHSVSPEAYTWLSLGLNSDVASSRLKLASVYYSVGDFRTTENILNNIIVMYNQSQVEAVCSCYDQGSFLPSARFDHYSYTHNELSIRHIVVYCVRFIPEEIHCQPPELQYEMFRSTQQDRAQRIPMTDFWMDWAVVDSLPYLYFLQYKTYGHLQRYAEQQQALNNLAISIHTTRNLQHQETALNLLGQCYQQENRHTEALQCYINSLRIRPTNNTAKLHICLLLYAIYTNIQSMQ